MAPRDRGAMSSNTVNGMLPLHVSLLLFILCKETPRMPTSTMTSKGQTTVPKEVREALDLVTGDKLTWEVKGGRVAVTTERPAFFRWEGYVKHGPRDVVKAVQEARKRRGRI